MGRVGDWCTEVGFGQRHFLQPIQPKTYKILRWRLAFGMSAMSTDPRNGWSPSWVTIWLHVSLVLVVTFNVLDIYNRPEKAELYVVLLEHQLTWLLSLYLLLHSLFSCTFSCGEEYDQTSLNTPTQDMPFTVKLIWALHSISSACFSLAIPIFVADAGFAKLVEGGEAWDLLSTLVDTFVVLGGVMLLRVPYITQHVVWPVGYVLFYGFVLSPLHHVYLEPGRPAYDHIDWNSDPPWATGVTLMTAAWVAFFHFVLCALHHCRTNLMGENVQNFATWADDAGGGGGGGGGGGREEEEEGDIELTQPENDPPHETDSLQIRRRTED